MSNDQFVYDFEKELYARHNELEISDNTFEFAKIIIAQLKEQIEFHNEKEDFATKIST